MLRATEMRLRATQPVYVVNRWGRYCSSLSQSSLPVRDSTQLCSDHRPLSLCDMFGFFERRAPTAVGTTSPASTHTTSSQRRRTLSCPSMSSLTSSSRCTARCADQHTPQTLSASSISAREQNLNYLSDHTQTLHPEQLSAQPSRTDYDRAVATLQQTIQATLDSCQELRSTGDTLDEQIGALEAMETQLCSWLARSKGGSASDGEQRQRKSWSVAQTQSNSEALADTQAGTSVSATSYPTAGSEPLLHLMSRYQDAQRECYRLLAANNERHRRVQHLCSSIRGFREELENELGARTA
jgi:hypothetical protein